MGIVVWGLSATAAYVLARIVPIARRRGRRADAVSAIVTAMLFGIIATALDFGGWNEPDWRAALFTFLGAMAAIGLTRALRRRLPPAPAPAAPPDRRRADS